MWSPAEPWFDGPSQSILTPAERVTVSDSETTISRQLPLRWQDEDTFLVAVPPGDLSVSLIDLNLRNIENGAIEPVIAGGELLEDDFPRKRVDSIISVKEFGTFRRTRAAVVSVGRFGRYSWQSSDWEIADYTVAVHYPEYSGTGTESPEELLFGEVLDSALVAPEAAERFASAAIPTEFPGPDAWLPLPAVAKGTRWLSIPIEHDDLYFLDGRWFEEAGMEAAAVDPSDVVVYRGGEVVPTALVGDGEEGFASGERVVFYAEGNDSPETTVSRYLVGVSPRGLDRRGFEDGPPLDETFPTVSRYLRTYVAEEDHELLTTLGAFLSIRNMSWVWHRLSTVEPVTATFDLPGFAPESDDTVVTATLVLHLGDGHKPGNSKMALSIGNEKLDPVPLGAKATEYTVLLPVSSLGPTGNKLTIELDRPKNAAPIHLDKIVLDYRSFLKVEDGRLEADFSDSPSIAGDVAFRAIGMKRGRELAVDISDSTRPIMLSGVSERGFVRFSGKVHPESRIVFIQDDALTRAPAGEDLASEDWWSRRHSADVLVIYHPIFRDGAELLAKSIRRDGFKVATVDVTGIYEAFSDGDLSSMAIRDFLAFAVSEWEGRRPQAAILIGDSSSDGRGIARNGVPNYMPIPLWNADGGGGGHSFASDSVYTWVTPGDEAADIVLGRISSSTAEEALATARNIDAYRQSAATPAEWASRVVAIADTGNFENTVNDLMSTEVFAPYHSSILSADRVAWEDNYFLPPGLIDRVEDSKVSPLLTAAIESSINDGAALVTFFGHGAPNLWSNQRFWFGGGTPNSDILRLENEGRLPFVASFTCNNAVVDYPNRPWNVCLAEDFMRHEGKGAIACFMPSGPGYLSNHGVLAEGFFRAMQVDGSRRMGVLGELGRISYQARRQTDDHSRMFLFLGDPTLKLASPPQTAASPNGNATEDGGVTIGEYHRSGPGEWSILLSNNSASPSDATIRGELLRDDGSVSEILSTVEKLAGREKVLLTARADVPTSETYAVRFRVEDGSGRLFRESLPSSEVVRIEVPPAGSGSVGAFLPLASAEPLSPGKDEMSLRVPVYNGLSEGQSLKFEGTVEYVDGTTDPLSLASPFVPEGQVTYQKLGLPSKVLNSEGATVAMTLKNADDTPLWSGDWEFDPKSVPDLAIVPGSLGIDPERPTDGLTVFVNVAVTNLGGTRSPAVGIELSQMGADGKKEVLTGFPSPRATTLDPINPGESREVRLRWDPTNNAGEHTLMLTIDPSAKILDADRTNNSTEFPLKVRTKSRLTVGAIGVRREGDDLVLSGPVGNVGETDAQLVAVTFYKSSEQTPENQLQEVILDRVPAGKTIEAEYRWHRPQAEANDSLTPTYTVSLKGSLMRVSSVAETDSENGSR